MKYWVELHVTGESISYMKSWTKWTFNIRSSCSDVNMWDENDCFARFATMMFKVVCCSMRLWYRTIIVTLVLKDISNCSSFALFKLCTPCYTSFHFGLYQFGQWANFTCDVYSQINNSERMVIKSCEFESQNSCPIGTTLWPNALKHFLYVECQKIWRVETRDSWLTQFIVQALTCICFLDSILILPRKRSSVICRLCIKYFFNFGIKQSCKLVICKKITITAYGFAKCITT